MTDVAEHAEAGEARSGYLALRAAVADHTEQVDVLAGISREAAQVVHDIFIAEVDEYSPIHINPRTSTPFPNPISPRLHLILHFRRALADNITSPPPSPVDAPSPPRAPSPSPSRAPPPLQRRSLADLEVQLAGSVGLGCRGGDRVAARSGGQELAIGSSAQVPPERLAAPPNREHFVGAVDGPSLPGPERTGGGFRPLDPDCTGDNQDGTGLGSEGTSRLQAGAVPKGPLVDRRTTSAPPRGSVPPEQPQDARLDRQQSAPVLVTTRLPGSAHDVSYLARAGTPQHDRLSEFPNPAHTAPFARDADDRARGASIFPQRLVDAGEYGPHRLDNDSLESERTLKRRQAVQASYRMITNQFDGARDGKGPPTAADAERMFAEACSNAGLAWEDASSLVSSSLTGTARVALAREEARKESSGTPLSTSAKWDFIKATFDTPSAHDDSSFQTFTGGAAYTWSDCCREARRKGMEGDMATFLLLKGMDLQHLMPKEWQSDIHLLTFMRNVARSAPFYGSMSALAMSSSSTSAALRAEIQQCMARHAVLKPANANTPSGGAVYLSHDNRSHSDRPENRQRWSRAAKNYLAQVPIESDDAIIIPDDELDEVVSAFYEHYAPNQGSYGTRRTVSDNRLERHGIFARPRSTAKSDTRDPPPGPGDDPSRPNRSRDGKVLRCHRCNSRWHLLFKCPQLKPLQHNLFATLLNELEEMHGGEEEDTEVFIARASATTMDMLELAASKMFSNVIDMNEFVTKSYSAESNVVGSIVDTGCPFSVCGTSAFAADCARRGMDAGPFMAKLKPTGRRFSFGKTVYPCLGLAPAWIDSVDGRTHTLTTHIVEADLPDLVGLNAQLALDVLISPKDGEMVCRAWLDANDKATIVPLTLQSGHLYCNVKETLRCGTFFLSGPSHDPFKRTCGGPKLL